QLCARSPARALRGRISTRRGRPIADECVLDLRESRPLRRADLVETRRGVCRLGSPLAKEIAGCAPRLRTAMSPHANACGRAAQLRRAFGSPHTATPQAALQ